jgi:hypothetical protein
VHVVDDCPSIEQESSLIALPWRPQGEWRDEAEAPALSCRLVKMAGAFAEVFTANV